VGERLHCPRCGAPLDRFDQPRLTVDALVTREPGEVLLVERGHPPPGWALPGGFVDAGESLEEAVARELEEETGLRARRVRQFHTYSDPGRDPRHPTVSTVFLVDAEGTPRAGDDAAAARFFPWDALPRPLAFDHERILEDARAWLEEGRPPGGGSGPGEGGDPSLC
jgi:ADP-ribose pyrophosphatase YjhB (NUDIX family)